MKRRTSILIMALVLFSACANTPVEIPSGTWNYELIVNGIKAGTATITNEKSGDSYIIRSEMFLKIGTIENRSLQIIKETADFKPLSLEVINTVTDSNSGKVQEINKNASFKENEVTVRSGTYKSTFRIEEPFILDGNFFFSELLKNRFRKGTVVKSMIYEPAVELEEPILVVVEVMGRKKIDVKGRSKNLIHIKQKVEKLKSMDVYIDENGVTQLVTIKMLNNIFELVKID